MSFVIKEVVFNNFRNYADFSFELGEELTVVIGNNAVGKTNIIEGLQLLTTGESFRNPTCEELVFWDGKQGALWFEAKENKRELSIKAVLTDKRNYYLNGKKKRIAEIKGVFPAVLFTPDDLRLIKSSAEKRRNALDNVGTQLSHSYNAIKNDYEKIIKQRNILLKEDDIPESLFHSWTESLISVGTVFYKHRTNLFYRMKDKFVDIYTSLISYEDVDLTYVSSWDKYRHQEAVDTEEIMREVLSMVYPEERARRISLIGPHRDELVFSIKGKDARQYGSQGQQRLLVLAWKLAEVEVIKEINGQTPLLLLDDVMSELDFKRREALLSFIEKNVQTVITTTNSEYFSSEMLQKATILRI